LRRQQIVDGHIIEQDHDNGVLRRPVYVHGAEQCADMRHTATIAAWVGIVVCRVVVLVPVRLIRVDVVAHAYIGACMVMMRHDGDGEQQNAHQQHNHDYVSVVLHQKLHFIYGANLLQLFHFHNIKILTIIQK
jgi:hypothetical protein